MFVQDADDLAVEEDRGGQSFVRGNIQDNTKAQRH